MSYVKITKIDREKVLTEIASFDTEHTPHMFQDENGFWQWALSAPQLAMKDVILRERLRERVAYHITDMLGTICRQNKLQIRDNFDVKAVEYKKTETGGVLWVPYGGLRRALEFHFSDKHENPSIAVMHVRGCVKLDDVMGDLALRTYALANPDADGMNVPVIGEYDNGSGVAVAAFHHTQDIGDKLFDLERAVNGHRRELDDLRKAARTIRVHSESAGEELDRQYEAKLDELASCEDYQALLRFPVPETTDVN